MHAAARLVGRRATGRCPGHSLRTACAPALQVGAVTGLVCRAVRQLSAAATGRVALKLTTAGIELDVGGSRRFSEVATAGCAVTVGLQARAAWRAAARCRMRAVQLGRMLRCACPAAHSCQSRTGEQEREEQEKVAPAPAALRRASL